MTNSPTFHPFPRLPAELREAVWRYCLPYRVCELDQIDAELVYFCEEHELPCTLRDTSNQNDRPPILTRVCHEARALAFRVSKEHRRIRVDNKYPHDAYWRSSTYRLPINRGKDCIEDILHLNWTNHYEPLYGADHDELTPIQGLAAMANGRRASMMIERLEHTFDWDNVDNRRPPKLKTPTSEQREFIESFQRFDGMYLVVMQVVVVHTDQQTGAATGLFGFLGDAPVQIIRIEDEEAVQRYFEVANSCDTAAGGSKSPLMRRIQPALAKQCLRDVLVREYGSEELVTIMEPAVMFRLCTQFCQTSNTGA